MSFSVRKLKKLMLAIMAVFVIIIYFPNLVIGETENTPVEVTAISDTPT